MSKFKVGDRVRRVRESTWPEDYGTAGKEYDVISVEDFSGNVVVISGKGAAAADAFELVPTQAAFKAGDRVRCVSVCGGSAFTVGETYTVRKVANGLVYVDEFEFQAMFSDRFEPVAVAPATATLNIEAGKFYKTRDGRKVKVTIANDGTRMPHFHDGGGNGGHWLLADGKSNIGDSDNDLVAEWVDEPPTPIAATVNLDLDIPFPQVGDAVLIPGVISAINQSPRGTNYNIVFETQNRRMSLHFLEEDFILDEDGDDDGDCLCDNDNGPMPHGGDRAKAFDAIGDWLRAVAVRRAA